MKELKIGQTRAWNINHTHFTITNIFLDQDGKPKTIYYRYSLSNADCTKDAEYILAESYLVVDVIRKKLEVGQIRQFTLDKKIIIIKDIDDNFVTYSYIKKHPTQLTQFLEEKSYFDMSVSTMLSTTVMFELDTLNNVNIDEEKESEDIINKSPHYNTGKFEVIEVIEDWGLGFNLGNTIKYIARAGKKDKSKHIEDLKKARYYLDREIKNLEIK